MTRPCLLMIALWAAGCGGANAGLDLHFRAGSGAWAKLVEESARAPTPTARAGMLYSISADTPALLLAHDTTGAERWRSEIDRNALLLATDDVVLTVEGNSLVVRDATTGRTRFTRTLEGGSLLGAAADGNTLVCVSATPSISAVDPTSAIFALDPQTGSTRWERLVTAALGAPILRNNVVFVPWNRQGLTAIDAATGHERARMEPERMSIDWLRQDDGALSYGTDQLFDLTCTPNTSVCAPMPSPFASAPGHPALHPSAYRVPTPSGITTQLRMTHDAGGGLRMADDRAYLVFYRYVFAYSSDGTLAWVQVMDHDVVHARAVDGALLLLDKQGRITSLRALDGHRSAGVTLGHPLVAAQLTGTWPQPASHSATDQAPSLHEGLRAVIVDHDNRLVVARGYAVEQLARDPDPVVTKELLAAYEDRATPSGLRQVIARALIERRTGSEHLIAALARHHDFLTQVFPPPLSVVVPALSAMNERRAVPALVAHLQDPATPSADIAQIADALTRLGDATLISQLLPWLQRYRASQAFAGDPATVTSLAKAIVGLGGVASAALLSTTADADDTHPVFAAALREALVTETAAEPVVAAAPEAEAPKQVAKQLSQQDINAAFSPHTEALRRCTFNELASTPELLQVRIAFVARPDGSSHGFAFAPASTTLTKCLKPIVDALRLPPFDSAPRLATFVVELRGQVTEPTVAPPGVEADAEWWSWYAREIPADGVAWWSRYVDKDLDWLPPPSDTDAPARVAEPTHAPTSDQTPHVAPTTPSTTDAAPVNTTSDPWWLPAQP